MEQQVSKWQKIILAIVPIIAIAIFISYKYIQSNKYNFNVNSQTGNVALSDFRGAQTFVYFGYGLCPDICPTTLVSLAEAFKMLPEDELKNVNAVFITLDPERDDVAKLDQFVKYFHPKIIGTATSLENTQKLALNYGVKFQKVEQPNSSIGYSIAHSADLFLIDKNGNLKAVLPFGVTPQEIVKAIN
jgi:protein SCO1/2